MVDQTLDDEVLIEEPIIEEVVIEEPVITPEEQAAIDADIERLRRIAFEDDLKLRYSLLNDRNSAFHQKGISNPDLHFNQLILYAKDEALAEQAMKDIEIMDKAIQLNKDKVAYISNRKEEYSKIDILFLEALAEKEAGDTTKMDAYLIKRSQIKLANPKPQS